eukprot:57796-Prymnesium_polylepis.1
MPPSRPLGRTHVVSSARSAAWQAKLAYTAAMRERANATAKHNTTSAAAKPQPPTAPTGSKLQPSVTAPAKTPQRPIAVPAGAQPKAAPQVARCVPRHALFRSVCLRQLEPRRKSPLAQLGPRALARRRGCRHQSHDL